MNFQGEGAESEGTGGGGRGGQTITVNVPGFNLHTFAN